MRHLALIALLAVAALARPGGIEAACAGEGVPVPEIAKGRGEVCVRDTDFMRTRHMELLVHQRDDTVRQGVRPKAESLRQCLDCHAIAGGDGHPVSFESPKHFCRACHDYAAVRIDCFDCHASRPDKSASRQ
ncbi:MAG: Hdr-like menaquinol oxidoreductase cytochrome c subunit [Alphaproteobacteria bacterium]|jgi:hypothetical protein|nr:Hdr-like menaquinol oxidoreductase cytochrome c subunit [Alphaproteobacteria bacterium]